MYMLHIGIARNTANQESDARTNECICTVPS